MEMLKVMSTNSWHISFLKIGKIFKSKALSILEILNLLYSFLPLSDLLLEKLIEKETFSVLFLVQKFYKNCSTVTSSGPLLSFLQWSVAADEFYLLFGNVFFLLDFYYRTRKIKTWKHVSDSFYRGFTKNIKVSELVPSPLLHYELVWKMFFMKLPSICPILEMIINVLLERFVKVLFIFMLKHLMMSLISIYFIISKSRKGKASKY